MALFDDRDIVWTKEKRLLILFIIDVKDGEKGVHANKSFHDPHLNRQYCIQPESLVQSP